MELSQRLAESIFAGPGLETSGEDLALGSSNRLQVAVGNLLQVVKEATRKVSNVGSSWMIGLWGSTSGGRVIWTDIDIV